ncbi:MAG TPA: hypothetical protein VFD92_04780 [Candidatus Binatia bacterium]|nr:hypothetical protein [Candidatus Binatia bacterium]
MSYENQQVSERALPARVATIGEILSIGDRKWTQGKPDADGDRAWRACELTDANECELTFSVDGYRRRLIVRGDVAPDPADLTRHRDLWPSGVARPVITVALDAAPDRVASEIKRRLLPALDDAMAKFRARRARSDSYAAKVAANVARLRAAGLDLYQPQHRAGGSSYWTRGDNAADVQVSGDSVSINIRSLSIDMACAIARLLAGGAEG